MDELIRELDREIKSGNYEYWPEYIMANLRLGRFPKMRYVYYRCLAHEKDVGRYARGDKCPQESAECAFEPRLNESLLRNWINDRIHARDFGYNLFSLKKREFKEPVDPGIFLDAFYRTQARLAAWQLFQEQIMYFFEKTLKKLVIVVAELNILPDVPKYPVEALTWPELAEATNLRTDLIEKAPKSDRRLFSRQLAYCLENHSPITVLSTGSVYEERRRDKLTGRLKAGNPRVGITLNNYSKEEEWPLQFSVFG